MIEIIEYGTKKIAKCRMCGCKFSYEQEDLVHEDIDNYKGYKICLKCPQCNEEVALKQSK